MSEETESKVTIEEREDGPLVIKNLPLLENSDGSEVPKRPVMALCRCGASKRKPFCDGSHMAIEFKSAPEDVTERDQEYTYEGKDLTVYYNKVLCSHAAECSTGLKSVFDPARKPWVDPDLGSVDEVKKIVADCPSGALRFSEPDGPETHLESDDCYIRIEKNGPYHVCNVEIENVRWAKGASQKKFVLCRCGKSGNKPFCDGAHYDVKWKDDESG